MTMPKPKRELNTERKIMKSSSRERVRVDECKTSRSVSR